MSGIAEVTGHQLDLEVFDGQQPERDRLLFDADGHLLARNDRRVDSVAFRGRRHHRTLSIQPGSRPWVLSLSSTPTFNTSGDSHLSTLVLASGLVVSFLASMLAWSLGSSRTRAINLAGEMTSDLRHEVIERQDAERSLRQLTRLQAAIFDSAAHGIIVTDPRGVLQQLNPAAEALLGTRLQDLHGTTSLDFFLEPAELQARARDFSHALGSTIQPGFDTLSANAVASLPNEHEWTLVRRDRERRRVLLAITTLTDDRGAITGFLALAADVTARRAAEKRLQTFVEHAPAAVAMLDRDLRYIATSRRWLAEYGVPNQNLTGRISLESIPYDLTETAAECVELLYNQAEAKGLDLNLCVHPLAPRHLTGDPSRVRQVLLNLLGNALKFTSRGHVTVRITGILRPGDTSASAARIDVIDSGIGIPTDKLDLLFHKFSQTDSSTSRRFGGTGLGLAISRQLVELMGGTIEVESLPGRGSAFHFTVPVVSTGPNPAESPVESSPLPNQGRVLIVGSSPAEVEALSFALDTWNVGHAHVEGIAAAFETLRNAREAGKPFHTVLLDHAQLLGFEQLVPTLLNEATRTLLLLPGALRSESARYLADGFHGVLPRPFTRLAHLRSALSTPLASASANVAPDSSGTSTHPTPPPATPSSTRRSQPARRHLLLVEDTLVNQKLAIQILERLGCSVDLAEDGLQAVERATDTRYDVILMDCQLPQMDGYEATRRIRSLEAQRGQAPGTLPILALTASALPEDRVRCLEAGMNDVIVKPVRKADLERALDRWHPLLTEALTP